MYAYLAQVILKFLILSIITKNVTTIPCENAKFIHMVKVALLPFPREVDERLSIANDAKPLR